MHGAELWRQRHACSSRGLRVGIHMTFITAVAGLGQEAWWGAVGCFCVRIGHAWGEGGGGRGFRPFA